jgi:hypothetical protein
MSTSHIVTLLTQERDRIQAAIDALGGREGVMPDWVRSTPDVATAPAVPKKRKVSASARRKMAEGQKRRWAAINAAKAKAAAPKKAPSKKSAILAAVTPSAEDAEFKSKMSIAMKAAWAKRKKVVAGGQEESGMTRIAQLHALRFRAGKLRARQARQPDPSGQSSPRIR